MIANMSTKNAERKNLPTLAETVRRAVHGPLERGDAASAQAPSIGQPMFARVLVSHLPEVTAEIEAAKVETLRYACSLMPTSRRAALAIENLRDGMSADAALRIAARIPADRSGGSSRLSNEQNATLIATLLAGESLATAAARAGVSGAHAFPDAEAASATNGSDFGWSDVIAGLNREAGVTAPSHNQEHAHGR